MKKYIIGFILGAILCSILPISATVQKYVCSGVSYKIIVNGVEYKDDKQPALNLNGNTYVPLRNLGKLIGQEPFWNAEKKQVEINSADLTGWILVTDLIAKLGGETTIQSLLDQMVNKGKDGVYNLVHNGNVVRLQVNKGRSYFNLADLKTAGIYKG